MTAAAICGLAWIPVVFGDGQKRWFFETGEQECSASRNSGRKTS
jgi:hypothetical protein